MRSRLVRSFRFEAAHFLPRVPEGHKCARMHGHSYEIEVAVEGDIDPELGWVMDFSTISEHVSPLVAALDHQVLNDVPGLPNPTTELLAVWFWQNLAPKLPSLAEISISETPKTRCTYRGQ
ncbi:MAG: 6-carboxytetrahydropterin synthase QueD [Myxococcales bacterium]|jgi:6-pyruvoyltetrahydropterin/6-carboxytetrahydropterin synthase|nr:6-carboxytetrahydropterin synthase QueD [Myxococcales bacterium]HRC56506.1 6-carboxytetrahydropterin synthase QueD [Kofleriaceae bacterium]